MPRKTAEDLTNMVFGKLTAVSYYGKTNRRQSLWNCRCECGNKKVILAPSLKSGATTSCGCHNIQKIKERFTTHGHKVQSRKGTPEYRSWASMMTRCKNENSEKYEYYGGRGITVCERWNDFANFFADMGKRPDGRYSLDRIDVNGNYEPSNCRWASLNTQRRNIRPGEQNKSNVTGVTWNKDRQKWQVRISHKGIQYHLGLFEDLKEAKRVRKEAERKYDEL